MNFQAVKAAPGQYIQLQAVITDIKHMEGQQGWGNYALGKAQDGPGQIESVMFTCKKEMQFPTGLAVGHRCNWAGKFDANTQKMKLFFGNMAQNDVAAQAPVTPPPQAPPQTAPVAPQATNAPVAPPQPQHVPVGRDATGVSIERQVCIYTVGDIIESRPQMDMAEAGDWLAFFMHFAETGQIHITATHQSVDTTDYNRDQDDSDLPLEMRGAGKP